MKKGCDSINFNAPFSYEKFKVIPPPTYDISFSEIKISPKALFFSATTVAELDYTPDIAIFFNQEDLILVVTPSIKTEFSCPFFDQALSKKNVTLVHEKLAAAIRSTMNWPARKGTYRIPGVRAPNSPQPLLCFELMLGTCAKKSTKSIDPKAFLSACPTLQEVNRPNSKYVPFALPAKSSIPIITNNYGSPAGIIDLTDAS